MIDYFTIIGFYIHREFHKCKKNLTLSLMMLCYKCKILLTFRVKYMFYILLFISVLIFIIWTIITNKYLPSETLDTKNTDRTGYDERQRTMFLEIFSKNFCRFSLYLFHRYDFKIFALYQGHHTVYPLINSQNWLIY